MGYHPADHRRRATDTAQKTADLAVLPAPLAPDRLKEIENLTVLPGIRTPNTQDPTPPRHQPPIALPDPEAVRLVNVVHSTHTG